MDKIKALRIDDTVTVGNWTGPLDIAVNLMDDALRERLHSAMAPCDAQDFVDAYIKAHAEKFGGEKFVVG